MEEKSVKIKRKKEGYAKSSLKKKEYEKPGFQFRQIYLQQLGKKKKKKEKEVKKSKPKPEEGGSVTFMLDSDDESQEVKKVSKRVDSIINSSTLLPVSLPTTSNDNSNDRKSTLIVCPMSVLSNWTDQFQKHVDPNVNLQIYIYYGPDRVRDLKFLKQQDIIIT